MLPCPLATSSSASPSFYSSPSFDSSSTPTTSSYSYKWHIYNPWWSHKRIALHNPSERMSSPEVAWIVFDLDIIQPLSAHAASKCILMTVSLVVYLQRTLLRPRTGGDFVVAGLLVAWFAEMGGSEAEPKSNLAAVLALVVNVVSSMILALGLSCPFKQSYAS